MRARRPMRRRRMVRRRRTRRPSYRSRPRNPGGRVIRRKRSYARNFRNPRLLPVRTPHLRDLGKPVLTNGFQGFGYLKSPYEGALTTNSLVFHWMPGVKATRMLSEQVTQWGGQYPYMGVLVNSIPIPYPSLFLKFPSATITRDPWRNHVDLGITGQHLDSDATPDLSWKGARMVYMYGYKITLFVDRRIDNSNSDLADEASNVFIQEYKPKHLLPIDYHDVSNLHTFQVPTRDRAQDNSRRNVFLGPRVYPFRRTTTRGTTAGSGSQTAVKIGQEVATWSKYFPVNRAFRSNIAASGEFNFIEDAHQWIPSCCGVFIDPSVDPSYDRTSTIPRTRVYWRFQQWFSADFDTV